MQTSRVIVKVEELSVFCDLRIQGFGDVIGGRLFMLLLILTVERSL